MEADLKNRIAGALERVSAEPDEQRLQRIDVRVRAAMSIVPGRARRHRYLAPLAAAVALTCAVTGAIASGGLPFWLSPDKPAGHVGAFRHAAPKHTRFLEEFLHAPPGSRDVDGTMLEGIQSYIDRVHPGEKLLDTTLLRQLLNWTDPRGRHHAIVAAPTNRGNVCYFSWTPGPGESGGGNCVRALDARHPLNGGWTSGGHDTDVVGLASDDVTRIVVVERNGRASAAHLGTNAYWWTMHSDGRDPHHRAQFPSYLLVTTRDGGTQKFTLIGVPLAHAVATQRAVRASRAAKCATWGPAHAHRLAVCGYRRDGTRSQAVR